MTTLIEHLKDAATNLDQTHNLLEYYLEDTEGNSNSFEEALGKLNSIDESVDFALSAARRIIGELGEPDA